MRISKRGVSAVVASVLLILLVVILSSMIFFWAKAFIGDSDQDFGYNVKTCESVNFEVSFVSISGTDVTVDYVNRGDVDISAFEYRLNYNNGDSQVFNADEFVLAGESSSHTHDLGSVTITDIESVDVFPALRSTDSKLIVCREEGIFLANWPY